jgi:ubiquinol-cytochrome c reductase cytochrome b subunit
MLKRIWSWIDDRSGAAQVFRVLFAHPVPPSLAGNKGWLYIFGTAALTLFIVQVVTGVALATSYIPSTAEAFSSLQFITHQATLGRVIRGVHYFGASAMVILVVVHMARVFLTGSYKFPREVNWLSGVVLLLLVFGMAFTGQLLRWDEDAIGSVLVAAEQAGRVPIIGTALAHFVLAGRTIGAATLSRFYAVHVFLLPGLIFAFIGLHLFMVLRHGISEPPSAGQPVDPATYRKDYEALVKKGNRFYFPDVIWREALFAGAIVALLVILALVFGPKALKAAPDPTNTNVNPRPDWYLLWLFALLAVIPYGIEDYVIVLGPLLVVVALLVLPLIANRGERSPRRRPWSIGGVAAGVTVFAALLATGYAAPWAPRFETQPFTAADLGTNDPQALMGAQIFYSNGCQFCHGVAGRGGKRGPDLTHITSSLYDADIRQRMLNPPRDMPSYNGKLSNDQIDAIIAFLHTTAGPSQPLRSK